MSKKKRSKKRERIPVIDTLIDLAGAMTLDYLAAKRRQKNGTKRSKKIDPYAATGAAMGMGLIKDTDDIIKFGGVLGAMGAFDSDDDLPISTAAYMAPRDNRYAWRLNCEDGSAYGIDPNDYETRDEYNEALSREKHRWRDYCEDCALPGFVDSKNEEKTERNAGYLVVSQSGGGMLRQGTREGIRRTPANRGMRAHRIVKGLDISEDVCHGMCP